jgi:hypothetical protein
MSSKINQIVLLVFSFFNFSLLPNSAFATNNLKPGIYEQIILAVNTDGDFVGYYKESMSNAKVGCKFFFDGRYTIGSSKIMTWSADFNATGSIEPKGDGVLFLAKDGDGHPGCSNLLPPEVTEGSGLQYSRTSIKFWTSLKIISSKRAYIHKSPDPTSITKKYLVSDDVIGILSKKDNWYEFDFVGKNEKNIRGWISADDVVDLKRPK